MIFAVLMNLRKPRLYVVAARILRAIAWQPGPTGGSCLHEARASSARTRHRLRVGARPARRAGRCTDRARSVDQLSAVVSAAGTPADGRHRGLRRRAPGTAAASHEPLLARALRAASVREEHVRSPG